MGNQECMHLSYQRQGIADLELQIHLGLEAAVLECKDIFTTWGERNREMICVHAIIQG